MSTKQDNYEVSFAENFLLIVLAFDWALRRWKFIFIILFYYGNDLYLITYNIASFIVFLTVDKHRYIYKQTSLDLLCWLMPCCAMSFLEDKIIYM